MAKEHLKLQQAELKKQKDIAKTFPKGVGGWNRNLIEDLEANIARTKRDIDLIARRLGHR